MFLMLVLFSLVASSLQDIYHPFPASKTRSSSIDTGFELVAPREEMDTIFWLNKAQNTVKEKYDLKLNKNVAKNIIFFLGDGMSIATLTTARILKGQRLGKTGEESTLSFENFPFSGLSKTYCTNGQVADSACTSTAYSCGVKANIMTLGVNAHVTYNDCASSKNVSNHVESLATWAQRAGKSTGIVTTTTVTHASPSGSYAHAANRMWESDTDMTTYGADPSQCTDIATQLITTNPGSNFNVILGGGRGKFLPPNVLDISGIAGERSDGKNLIEQWKMNNPSGVFVDNRNGLLSTNFSATDRLFGMFHSSSMDFHMLSNKTEQPTLEEMTEAAIRVAQNNPNGYYLFIEGGRIDHGHHGTVAGLALDEALEFDKAIGLARRITSEEDTLIVISSDHSHTMTMAGYQPRGSDILNVNKNSIGPDGIPYTTLNYGIGLVAHRDETGKRIDLTGKITSTFMYPGNVEAMMGTHAGDDVGIFASGPHSHLFSGVMEQNMIPHLMAYSSCVGNGATACNS